MIEPSLARTHHCARRQAVSRYRQEYLAIQRCILMTTKPGDLVLDPTSGSRNHCTDRSRKMGPTLDQPSTAHARASPSLVNAYWFTTTREHLLIGSQEGFPGRAASGARLRRQPPLAKQPGRRAGIRQQALSWTGSPT